MSKISNMDKIYKELFGATDTVEVKMTKDNTQKVTMKIEMDENNNITVPNSRSVSKSSKNSTEQAKSSNEKKRKREDDLVKESSKKPRSDDKYSKKTEIKDETKNKKSSTNKNIKKYEDVVKKSDTRVEIKTESKDKANNTSKKSQPEGNLLKKAVKTSEPKKSSSKDEKSNKTKKELNETSQSDKGSKVHDKTSRSEDSSKNSKSSQKSEKLKTTSSSKTSEIKKDSKDRVKSEKTKDLKQSRNSESTNETESSKTTQKPSTKITDQSSKTVDENPSKEKSRKQEKDKKAKYVETSKPDSKIIKVESPKDEVENNQTQSKDNSHQVSENITKNDESIKETITVPKRIEETPQTVPLFGVPKKIEECSQQADKDLDEKLMRLYGSFQKSTSSLQTSQKIIKNPQQVIQSKTAVNIQEIPQLAPIRINQNRLPKRKLDDMSENHITEQKFTVTKPESFKFNKENPKEFGSVPTQSQTSVERLKEAFKIPRIPKKEPVKQNAFQRRLMNQNSIKSSIKKCNQIKLPQNETSPTQQEPKRFKDIETELLFAKIEEFYKIPELVQPIEDLQAEIRQVKQQEIINSWYTVENSFLMSPPTKENGRRSSLKMKIRKVSMDNAGQESERMIDSNLRKMIDNYSANIENLVNGIGI